MTPRVELCVLRSPFANVSDASWNAAAEYARECLYRQLGIEREPTDAEIEEALDRLEEMARDDASLEPEEVEWSVA
jgi:hypothetical protein